MEERRHLDNFHSRAKGRINFIQTIWCLRWWRMVVLLIVLLDCCCCDNQDNCLWIIQLVSSVIEYSYSWYRERWKCWIGQREYCFFFCSEKMVFRFFGAFWMCCDGGCMIDRSIVARCLLRCSIFGPRQKQTEFLRPFCDWLPPSQSAEFEEDRKPSALTEPTAVQVSVHLNRPGTSGKLKY